MGHHAPVEVWQGGTIHQQYCHEGVKVRGRSQEATGSHPVLAAADQAAYQCYMERLWSLQRSHGKQRLRDA